MKKIAFWVIILFILVGTVAGYLVYTQTPDYVIPEEFLEQYEQDDVQTSHQGAVNLANRSSTPVHSSEETSITESLYCSAEYSLNVRDEPSSKTGAVIGTLFRGDVITVKEHLDNGWLAICWEDNVLAYVNGKYTSEEEPSEIEVSSSDNTSSEEYEYSEEDIYLIAQVCYSEAGGCDRDEMARCGKVFINRYKTSYREFTCCDTLWNTLTHENAYNDTLDKIQKGIVPSEDALEVARGLVDGTIEVDTISDEAVWQPRFRPSWPAIIEYVSEWGHYFCRPVDY